MTKSIAILLSILLLLSCQKRADKEHTFRHQKWLNQSYVDFISHTLEIKDSCLPILLGIELYRDSAIVSMPSEVITMAVKQINDSLFLIDKQKRTIFKLRSTSVNLSLKKENCETVLTPYNGQNSLYDEFALRVNKVLFAGNYKLLPTKQSVTLSATGKIIGLKPYLFYAPCLGGLCMKVPESKSNLIWLGDSVSGVYYSWNKYADTLILYSLTSNNTAKDNSYYRQNIKYKLLKER
jgi:hypothetical protein